MHDLTLPDSSGFETFTRISAHAPHVPVIVLSGLDDEELAIHTVHLGAQDYLAKNQCNGALLTRSMRYAIERGRVERALARERDMLQLLLDNLPDYIFFKDRESRFIRANPALAGYFGVAHSEDLVGRSDAEFLTPADARRTRDDELRVIESGEPIVGQTEERTLPNGEVSWTFTTKLPLRDGQGNIVGVTGISRDITPLKIMEEALATERNFLRGVIDNLPDPIFVKDRDGRYLVDNPAHRAFLGVSTEQEVFGRTTSDFFPATLAKAYRADDQKVFDGEPLVNHEEMTVDKQGAIHWLSTTKVPLRNDRGEIFGLACIRRDVTQRKRNQERLQKLNDDLMGALSQLKSAHGELHEMQLQLIEAEKMKSIGRLAAGVAHEVKNPLAIITMGVEYLASQKLGDDPNVPMILCDISEAVKRADDVIKGMLDFSAPRTLEVEEGSFNAMIEHALLLVRGEMDSELHIVKKELPPDLPPVRFDRSKMSQVFVNLFTNAIHAMPKGGTLLVRTYVKQLTGVGANIGDERSGIFRVGQKILVAEVEDTGHGIPNDKISKLFDPFFTTKPTGKGTGLGLSVVRSIIDLHVGTIDIRNRADGGAKVTIMLKA